MDIQKTHFHIFESYLSTAASQYQIDTIDLQDNIINKFRLLN